MFVWFPDCRRCQAQQRQRFNGRPTLIRSDNAAPDHFILIGNDKLICHLFVAQAVIIFRHAGNAMLGQPGADPIGCGFADKPQRILSQQAIGSALGII
ncbi:hypothetical protein LWU48_10010 [Enterobacter hormaechei]|uniref:hypothetical protein n=1 Tax=Enterobacter cloacae complex TaxID=354276 RepID=UPI001FEDACB9|nr:MULTISPECIES: hypothetical protein [Enterobacter cloacae complex]MCE1383920.1 hypothetical protein [Enterobacter hormaechei]MCE1401508.1 hypothetical protein [Enterobacter hormaechei]MCK7443658.1 hypothetical protein [Enterobacter roggenkampii]